VLEKPSSLTLSLISICMYLNTLPENEFIISKLKAILYFCTKIILVLNWEKIILKKGRFITLVIRKGCLHTPQLCVLTESSVYPPAHTRLSSCLNYLSVLITHIQFKLR